MVKKDDTRGRILCAALDEFASKGLSGARVDKIAQLAKVNKAMIYYYFNSKEELFNQLFQSELEQFKKEVVGLMAGHDVNSLDDM